MKRVTAKAPANIAFIKYWGKKNESLRIPANSSISMNLSEVFTQTSVEFSANLKSDKVKIDNLPVKGSEKVRVVRHLDMIRKLSGLNLYADVTSNNNFPKGTGLASSASGFAALTLAAAKAAGLDLQEKKLSILARIGSGSACRSIPSGFVEWKEGNSSENSYAHSLYPPEYWDICDVIAVVGEVGKKVSSTEGHTLVDSSPFYKSRILEMPKKIRQLKSSFEKKDFTDFGRIIEAEAINMHSVMMTSSPALYYWTPKTMEVMLAVVEWRDKELECYFTIDAGPNVHIMCLAKYAQKVKNQLKKISGIKRIIINNPSIGARLI